MAVSAMCTTGVPPVVSLSSFCCWEQQQKKKKKRTAGTAVLLTGRMPVLQDGATMNDPLANWKKRHRNRTNFWIHMVGIPASFVAAPVFLILRHGWLALSAFVAGYALQFLGHLVEGNKSGEEELVRRFFSPRTSSRPEARKGPRRAGKT